jgi:hypothetical protein
MDESDCSNFISEILKTSELPDDNDQMGVSNPSSDSDDSDDGDDGDDGDGDGIVPDSHGDKATGMHMTNESCDEQKTMEGMDEVTGMEEAATVHAQRALQDKQDNMVIEISDSDSSDDEMSYTHSVTPDPMDGPGTSNKNQVEVTPDIAPHRTQVGLFWSPEHLDASSVAILKDIDFFYTLSRIKEYLIPLVMHQSRVSGRALNWLVTNYSKKYAIVYRWRVFENHAPEIINIYSKYNEWLAEYGKKGFDPFRRSSRVYFMLPASTSTHVPTPAAAAAATSETHAVAAAAAAAASGSYAYTTSVAQLNFYYFAWIHGIYQYASQNHRQIMRDMKATMQSVQVPVDTHGRRYRRQLNRSPPLKCGVLRMDTLNGSTSQPSLAATIANVPLTVESSDSLGGLGNLGNLDAAHGGGRLVPASASLLPIMGGIYKLKKKKEKPPPDPNVPKRPRGRPRKYPKVDTSIEASATAPAAAAAAAAPPALPGAATPDAKPASPTFDVTQLVQHKPSCHANSVLTSSTYGMIHGTDGAAASASASASASSNVANSSTTLGKRKKPPIDPNAPKRKRGRPRKIRTPEEELAKLQKSTQDDDDPYKAIGIENPNVSTHKKKATGRQQALKAANSRKAGAKAAANMHAATANKLHNSEFLARDDSTMLNWFVQ